MKLTNFSKRLMEIFPRLSREISVFENNEVTEGQITTVQWLVLEHLASQGPCPMSDLSNVMHRQCSSMTGMIDRLIRLDMVERQRDPKDRRVVRVRISTKGRQLVRRIRQQKQKGLTKLFSRLNEKERADYLKILEKLHYLIVLEPHP